MYEYCIPYIQKIFPQFDRSWVLSHHVWKAHYSQPVITKGYSKLIPDFKTPLESLWICNMAQIYPEDRGTNYAVRYGRRVAQQILNEISNGQVEQSEDNCIVENRSNVA